MKKETVKRATPKTNPPEAATWFACDVVPTL
jgi:hypothetical protein